MGRKLSGKQQPRPNVWGDESARMLAAEKMKLNCADKPRCQESEGESQQNSSNKRLFIMYYNLHKRFLDFRFAFRIVIRGS